MAMLAIGGHDRILGPEHLHHAHRDRLFAVAQVQEAANLLLLIELRAAILEAADAQHLREQIQHLLARRRLGW